MKIWTSSRTREKKALCRSHGGRFRGNYGFGRRLDRDRRRLNPRNGLAKSSVSSAALSGGDRALPLPDFASLPPRTARRACFYSGRTTAGFSRRTAAGSCNTAAPLCIRTPPEKWNTVSRKSAGWPERTCFRQAPWKSSMWSAFANARTAACSFASHVMGTAVPAGAPSSLQTATGMKSICCGSLNKDNGALKQQSGRDSGGANSAAPNDRDGRNQNCGKISERKPGYTLSRYLFLPPMGRTACRMP